MSNNKYKLSIIIPTKNRKQYCAAAVKQILLLGHKELQIIVQDNSEDDELSVILKDEIECGKVTYNYVPGDISFVDNFSIPISLCEGQYVCMIGDDDGILANIMKVVDTAITNDSDAVIPGLNSVYFWPTEQSIIKGGENGYLCLSYIKNKSKKINPEQGLRQLMKKGGQDYQKCDLPRLYHGIVKRTMLEKIKTMTGHYFMGLTPDIYMAVALGIVCKNVLRIGYPITVSGICSKSGSSDSATGKHTGKLEDAPHFRGHKEYQWDKKAPAIYTVESIWAETALHALNVFGRKDLYNQFNIMALDGECLVNYPPPKHSFKNIIINHLIENNISYLKTIVYSRICFVKRLLFKVVRRLLRRRNDVIKYYNVPNIEEAVKLTEAKCP